MPDAEGNMMPKYTLLALLAVSFVAGGEITFEYELDISSVEIFTWMDRDAVSIPGGAVPFDVGMPALPGESFSFVVPQGTSITGVSVEVHTEESLEGGPFDITPVECRTFSEPRSPYCSRTVNTRDDLFPAAPVGEYITGNRTGFRIGAFVLVPFRYRPLSGGLSVITSATVTVEYDIDPAVPAISLSPRQIETAAGGLAMVLDNPGMLDPWAPVQKETDVDWSAWIVVGDAGMETVLQPLVDHRIATHGSAEFVGLDWIYANYTGWDTAEQIRNFLKDAYLNHGLVYALIVGDHGETTRISSLQVGENILNNVSDHYYMDLDGSWDLDGDHLYGERSDGIELLSDLYVGRFSSDVPSYVSTMVEKTIAYETTAPAGDWRTTAVLMGAGLWPESGPSGYWGSFVCDSIDLRLPTQWTVHKLYENPEWHPNNQILLIASGASYATPQGHGWSGGVAWYDHAPTDIISNGNYTGMTNQDMLCVFHSMACMSGELTNVGCIAERLMLAPWGGAIAVMFNSSYGWGTPPSTGPSEWLEIHFAEQMFVYGQYEVGVAQAFAKDVVKFMPGVPLLDWVIQENNLLGDPALLFASGQTGIEGTEPAVPSSPELLPPSPNPASGSCVISWTGAGGASGDISIYDMSGRRVATPAMNSQFEDSGSISFDCVDDRGAPLPSGCYTVVLTSGTGTGIERLVVVR